MLGIKTKIFQLLHKSRWYYGHYRAYLNRDKTIREYLKKHRIRKLNLACWPHPEEGWLNTDLYGNREITPLDLTKNFPIGDNKFDYIFCEHAIEHFDINQGIKILQECYRILKPGGKTRIATPEINFLIRLYQKQKSPTQKKYILWAGKAFFDKPQYSTDTFIINNFFRAWGHKFIYDYKTLKSILEDVGFENVRKATPGQSLDPNLRNMESHWKSIGRKDFNNLETFVAEAIKPSQ